MARKPFQRTAVPQADGHWRHWTHDGLLRVRVPDFLVSFLLGYGVALHEGLPAGCCGGGESNVCLCRLEVRPCLLQLLIDFGRVNLG